MEGRPEELFELLEQLGKGSFGSVYKARHRPSGTIVAVKVIPLTGEDEEGLEDMRREISLLQECVHPNVVRYFGELCVHFVLLNIINAHRLERTRANVQSYKGQIDAFFF